MRSPPKSDLLVDILNPSPVMTLEFPELELTVTVDRHKVLIIDRERVLSRRKTTRYEILNFIEKAADHLRSHLLTTDSGLK